MSSLQFVESISHFASCFGAGNPNGSVLLPPTRLDLDSQVGTNLERGHAIMNAIRESMLVIDELFLERTPVQCQVIENILSAASNYIYGRDVIENRAAILKQQRFESIPPGVLLQGPRRFGKTVTIAMATVGMILNVPGIEVTIIAFGANARKSILELIKTILRTTFKITLPAKGNSTEHLTYIDPTTGDVRKVHAFSSDQHLRGVGGHVLILEEAGFMPTDVLRSVVGPVLEVSSACLVAITSPETSEDNAFHALKQSDQFKYVEISYVCPPCRDHGVTEACPHNAHLVPSHIGRKGNLTGAIFGTDDEDVQRETMGVVKNRTSANSTCFPAQHVNTMFSRPQREADCGVPFIFVSIDPNSGTDNPESANTSDFAIVSVANPGFCIVGLDAVPATTHHDWIVTIRHHLTKIREIPHYESATLVMDIELNGSMASSFIAEECQKYRDVVILNDLKRKVGTNTTGKLKAVAMELTRAALEGQEVSFHKQLVSSHPDPKKMLGEFKRQMKAYERMIVPSKSLTKASSVVYTGKGKNKDKADDMCFTFQRAVRTKKVFHGTSKYDHFKS